MQYILKKGKDVASFSHLIAISSAVSRRILMKIGTIKVLRLECNLAKSEFRNSKRLPQIYGASVEDGAR